MNFSKLVIYAVLIYVVVLVGVYLLQSKLLYYPNLPTRDHVSTPDKYGMQYESVNFISKDNIKLNGWFVPADDSIATILFFHGNAGNISHRINSIEIFNKLKLNVFIIDYRGYGKSKGEISEAGSYLDAQAAWDYLTEDRGINQNKIIIFGRSLGASVAAWLASQVSPAALILESGFSSFVSMGQRLYPFLPVKLLAKFEYNTAQYVSNINCPLLVAHSKADDVIPYAEGKAIFSAGSEPRFFLDMQGGHNDGYYVSGKSYVDGLIVFIESSLN